MTAQLTAPTIGAAVAFELAADRHGLEPDERYAAAELAAKAARRAGHELITTGDVTYALNRVLDARRPVDPEYADVDEAGQLALGVAGDQRAIPGLAKPRTILGVPSPLAELGGRKES